MQLSTDSVENVQPTLSLDSVRFTHCQLSSQGKSIAVSHSCSTTMPEHYS